MNIFVISRGYPESHDPQWGIFEASQAKALRALGHKVTILAVDGRTRFYPRKIGIKHLKEEGAYIYHLFPFSLLSFSPRLVTRVNQWMMRRLFRKVAVKEGTPEVIYAHYLNNMQNCMMIKPEFDGVIVGLEHWSELLRPKVDETVDITARKVYRKLDKVLTVSPALRDSLKKHYGVNATYVPNMVADEFINASRVRKPGDRFEFCAIGRLVEIKNFDLLIKAAAMLRDKGVDFSVKIIGSGPEQSDLIRLITELQLEGRVKLLGMRTRNEIIEILNSCDALVLPSDYETFGVVLIEAMAMGLPVIACNAGGPVDIIDESNGILIPVHDTGALADAMQYMAENFNKYDCEKIATECANKYSGENVARKVVEIFQELISKKKAK